MQGKGLIFSRHSPIQEVVSINAVEFEVTLSIAAHKRQEKKQNQGRRQQCCGKLSHANRPYSESRRNSISAVVNSPFRSLRGSECNRDFSSTTALSENSTLDQLSGIERPAEKEHQRSAE